jgi:hypothetical protein
MRRTWIAVAAAIAVLFGLVFYLTQKSDTADVAMTSSVTATSAPPAASPTPDPAVALARWAGGVCVARDGVGATLIDFGKDLTFDPNSGVSAADQFQAQLDAHLDEINAAMENLGTALGQVPIDYVEASGIITEVQGSGDELLKARDETAKHIAAAREAEDPLSLAAALVQAGSSAKATFDAGKEFIRVLDEATGPKRGELGDAFAAAPQCQ